MIKTYQGKVSEGDYGENWRALFIGSGDPICKQIENDIEQYGNYLSVRYYVSDEEKTLEQVSEDFIKRAMGMGNAVYSDMYSEITGYLWTDEELNVGGHNLFDRISDAEGKYINLVIEYSRNAP